MWVSITFCDKVNLSDLITLAGQIRQNKKFNDDMWGSSFLFFLFLPEDPRKYTNHPDHVRQCQIIGLVSSPEKFLGGVDDFPGSLPQYLMSLLFFGCKCCTFFECYREKESLETGMLAPPRPREEWLPRTRKFSRLPSPAPPQNFLFALDLNWTLIWHCFI